MTDPYAYDELEKWASEALPDLQGGVRALLDFSEVGESFYLQVDQINLLIAWLRSAIRDAEEIGPDPHAVNFARSLL